MPNRAFLPLLFLFGGLALPATALADLAGGFEQEFSRFADTSQQQFSQFSEANEKAFARDFIDQWQRFNEALSDPLPSLPKPRLQPGLQRAKQTESSPVAGSAPSATSRHPRVSGGFYGHPLLHLTLLDLPTLPGLQPNNLLQFREQALRSDGFIELIHLLGFMRQRIHADNYATILLARQLCGNHFATPNSATACAWILGQSQGLDVRVGLRQGQLLLLTPSEQEWYEQPYFEVDNLRLYIVNRENYLHLQGETYLQSGRHADATGTTRISLSSSFIPAQRVLHTSHRFGVPLQLDEDFVAYLHQLPLLQVRDYLNDKQPDYLLKQLQNWQELEQKRPAMDRFKSLLTHLQHWPYQIDQEQFGREKPLTLSESVFFPYTDCEDRVYALAALNQSFIHLDMAALRYPNHLSAAVKYEGNWLEADPTYVGASLGMRQPAYLGMDPEWLY
ncbi:MAG: hypothetical protein MI745_14245 [Pseudomonadales bacterium]|nr:hypothetical protein [Pseudomonadales bacterium]